jgi:hypothetical protein
MMCTIQASNDKGRSWRRSAYHADKPSERLRVPQLLICNSGPNATRQHGVWTQLPKMGGRGLELQRPRAMDSGLWLSGVARGGNRQTTPRVILSSVSGR